MSSFVLQLLIISAFGLMVQAAHVNNVSKKSTDTTMSNTEKNNKKLENNLYCASQSLYNARGQLQNAGFTLPSIPQVDINNNTKIIVNRMFHHFSDLCKYFTIAMTLKHQLQDHLFNTAPELNYDNANKLTTILTSLQTMANIFDDMKISEDNSRCVKLTPAQYKIMYYVRYTAPLLESLKRHLEGWYTDPSLYDYPEVQHC